jgi:hypothetical protein
MFHHLYRTASIISVSFTMDLECKLEKLKELTEMELAAGSGLYVYNEESSVEDNEVEAELQKVQEDASVGEKSNSGLEQCAEAVGRKS